jgi:large subunit ribosomal protein L7/L12
MAKMSTDELLDAFKDMTLLELTDFVNRFEDTFDVSARVPVLADLPPGFPGESPVDEQTEFDVILESAGERKVFVIKAIREMCIGLSLKEAKDLVDNAPKPVLQKVSKDVAEEAGAKLRAAGAAFIVK